MRGEPRQRQGLQPVHAHYVLSLMCQGLSANVQGKGVAGRQADRTEEARHEWLMVDVRCCLCFCVRRVVVCEGLKRKPGKRLCKSQSKSVVHMACLVVSWLANETREL